MRGKTMENNSFESIYIDIPGKPREKTKRVLPSYSINDQKKHFTPMSNGNFQHDDTAKAARDNFVTDVKDTPSQNQPDIKNQASKNESVTCRIS